MAPQFEGIDATANGQHLTPGQSLIGSATVQLQVRYLNDAQAKVRAADAWSYTVGNQAPVTMPRPPGMSVITTSTRRFTPPSPYGYTATFTVVITNADTGSVLTTRSFTLHWQSVPRMATVSISPVVTTAIVGALSSPG